MSDAQPVATALFRELERALGRGAVFLDHRSLEPGEPFPDRLESEVKSATIVLMLVSPRWLQLQTAEGIRRLDDPDDWVRRELEVALDASRRIIPILVEQAPALTKAAFKTIPKLEPLADLQSLPLLAREWDAHFEGIVAFLERCGFPRRARSALGSDPPGPRPFRSTVPARGRAPFEGRDELLDGIAVRLADASTTQLVALHGPSGVGKSELAREYARRQRSRYPGGTFVIDFRTRGAPIDLASIGRNVLQLSFPPDTPLPDQCLQSLLRLGEQPTLLVYDNVRDAGQLAEWLPPEGMPCHVLATSTSDRWDARWHDLRVPGLSDSAARSVVERIVGADAAARYADAIIVHAGGLPVELVPLSRSFAVAAERGTEPPRLELTPETSASYSALWANLDSESQLVLVGAAYFHPDRIRRDSLRAIVADALGWSAADYGLAVQHCRDLDLLAGEDPIRLHSLWGRFVLDRLDGLDASSVSRIRASARSGLDAAASAVLADPARIEVTQQLLAWNLGVSRDVHEMLTGDLAVDPGRIAAALINIGRFEEAIEWAERSVVAASEKGDVHGRVDQDMREVCRRSLVECIRFTSKT